MSKLCLESGEKRRKLLFGLKRRQSAGFVNAQRTFSVAQKIFYAAQITFSATELISYVNRKILLDGCIFLCYVIFMAKAEKPKTNIKENAGKLLLDVSKLTFASFILGGILRGELPQYILIIAGVVVSLLCAVIGLLWTSKKTDKE